MPLVPLIKTARNSAALTILLLKSQSHDAILKRRARLRERYLGSLDQQQQEQRCPRYFIQYRMCAILVETLTVHPCSAGMYSMHVCIAFQHGQVRLCGCWPATLYALATSSVCIHLHKPDMMMEHPDIIIVAETDELVIVDKSSTMVFHPTGSSRYNTLLSLLEMCFERKLYAIHRSLDRDTSGILRLFSKCLEAAQKWSKQPWK